MKYLPPKYEFPKELLIKYSPDNPAGPQFTAEEKHQQLIKGEKLYKELLESAHRGDNEFVIKPGDYRFTHEKPIYLMDIKREEDNPFVIKAYGVTFWINLNKHPFPGVNRSFEIHNSSNIVIEGLTMDSDPRNVIEGKVLDVDVENNRIKFFPFEGSFPFDESDIKKIGARVIPFKSDGTHIPALYDVENCGGINNLRLKSEERNEDGTYWVYLSTETLLKTISTNEWKMLYGNAGTLEKGDLLVITYGVAYCFNIYNCKNIGIANVNIYIADARLNENEGEGGNYYVNCKFISRPGTNQLVGGCDHICGRTMKGSIFDGMVVGRSLDDPINIFGQFGYVEKIDGNIVSLGHIPITVSTGDDILIHDKITGEILRTLSVKSRVDNQITVDEQLLFGKNDIIFRFPKHEYNNWIIKNSFFIDGHQRLLFQTGGTFENNYIINMGHQLQIVSNFMTMIEGGMVSEMTVKDNIIINTAVCPEYSTIVSGFMAFGKSEPIAENLVFENNLIIDSGKHGMEFINSKKIKVTDNIVINPLMNTQEIQQNNCAIFFNNCDDIQICNNVFIEDKSKNEKSAKVFGIEFCENVCDNENVKMSLDVENIRKVIYELSDHFKIAPKDVIGIFRKKLSEE